MKQLKDGIDGLEVAASDVLSEASELLQRQAQAPGDRVVGIELDAAPKVTVLRVVDDDTPPRVVWRSRSGIGHGELVASAGVLAVNWVNSLPEADRLLFAKGTDTGSAFRVYARPDTGEVALALRHQGAILEIGRRVIAFDAMLH